MGITDGVRGLAIAAAVVVTIGSVADAASAQRLGRASSAVRGGGSSSGSSGRSSDRGSSAGRTSRGSYGGGSLGRASGATRGSSASPASGGSSGRSRGSSWSGGRGSSGGDLDPTRSPPVRIGGRRFADRRFVVVPRSAPVAVDEPLAVERIETSPRDHWYGGSLGVRLVSPIVPGPRVAGERFVPGGGTPVGEVVEAPQDLYVEEQEDRIIGIVSADAGYVFDGVGRGTVSLRVELPASIDVFATYTAYIEPSSVGFDALALGRVGVGIRVLDDAAAQLRIGVALRHFHDWLGSVFGIDGVLGLDVVLEEPIVLGAEASIGTAGSAMVAQLRGTLGARFDRVQIYAGYEHVTLQPLDGESGGVDLSGPVAGVAVVID